MIDVKLIKKSKVRALSGGNGVSAGTANMLPEISASLKSLSDFNTAISNLLVPCDKLDNELSWLQALDPDGAGGIKAKSLKAKVGFWGVDFISALGKSDTGSSGGGGGGLVESIYRWGELGGAFSDTDNDTFNAYTIDRIYKELRAADSAISARLADYYTKAEADTRYALANTLSGYVKKVGDTMTGTLTIATTSDSKIILNNTDDETYWSLISFRDKGVEYGRLGTQGGTNITWNGHNILHAGNYAATLDGRYYTETEVDAKNFIKDAGDATNITFAYSKAGLTTASWLAAWNGKELRAISPSVVLSVINALPRTGGSMDNTNVVTNLNADLLDGVHLSDILASNVASATKLADDTAFTAWGRTFFQNGRPSSVSGNMDNVGNIMPAANSVYDIGSADNQFRYVYAKGFYAKAGSMLYLGANNNDHVFISEDGNVGFGVVLASHKVHVNGYVRATGLTLDGSHLLEWDDANVSWKFGGGLAASNNLVILGNGDDTVGITKGIEMCPHKDNVRKRVKLLAVAESAWSNSCGLAIYTGINSQDTPERVRIDGQGRVGINTSTPTHRLQVNGTTRTTALTLDGTHLLEWDATNEAWKFNGNVYATGGLTALGITELSATEARVSKLTADTVSISNAVFTVEGSEIYVTIGSTKYKLTKTAVTA